MKHQPYSWLLFAGEVLAGALTGAIFAYLGGQIGGFWGVQDDASGVEDIAGVILALVVTYPIGVAVGNTLYNIGFRRGSSFWFALSGSAAGVALILTLVEPLSLNLNTVLLWSIWALIPTVIAAIAVRVRVRMKRAHIE